jgi:hypothetical protein
LVFSIEKNLFCNFRFLLGKVGQSMVSVSQVALQAPLKLLMEPEQSLHAFFKWSLIQISHKAKLLRRKKKKKPPSLARGYPMPDIVACQSPSEENSGPWIARLRSKIRLSFTFVGASWGTENPLRFFLSNLCRQLQLFLDKTLLLSREALPEMSRILLKPVEYVQSLNRAHHAHIDNNEGQTPSVRRSEGGPRSIVTSVLNCTKTSLMNCSEFPMQFASDLFSTLKVAAKLPPSALYFLLARVNTLKEGLFRKPPEIEQCDEEVQPNVSSGMHLLDQENPALANVIMSNFRFTWNDGIGSIVAFPREFCRDVSDALALPVKAILDALKSMSYSNLKDTLNSVRRFSPPWDRGSQRKVVERSSKVSLEGAIPKSSGEEQRSGGLSMEAAKLQKSFLTKATEPSTISSESPQERTLTATYPSVESMYSSVKTATLALINLPREFTKDVYHSLVCPLKAAAVDFGQVLQNSPTLARPAANHSLNAVKFSTKQAVIFSSGFAYDVAASGRVALDFIVYLLFNPGPRPVLQRLHLWFSQHPRASAAFSRVLHGGACVGWASLRFSLAALAFVYRLLSQRGERKKSGGDSEEREQLSQLKDDHMRTSKDRPRDQKMIKAEADLALPKSLTDIQQSCRPSKKHSWTDEVASPFAKRSTVTLSPVVEEHQSLGVINVEDRAQKQQSLIHMRKGEGKGPEKSFEEFVGPDVEEDIREIPLQTGKKMRLLRSAKQPKEAKNSTEGDDFPPLIEIEALDEAAELFGAHGEDQRGKARLVEETRTLREARVDETRLEQLAEMKLQESVAWQHEDEADEDQLPQAKDVFAKASVDRTQMKRVEVTDQAALAYSDDQAKENEQFEHEKDVVDGQKRFQQLPKQSNKNVDPIELAKLAWEAGYEDEVVKEDVDERYVMQQDDQTYTQSYAEMRGEGEEEEWAETPTQFRDEETVVLCSSSMDENVNAGETIEAALHVPTAVNMIPFVMKKQTWRVNFPLLLTTTQLLSKPT